MKKRYWIPICIIILLTVSIIAVLMLTFNKLYHASATVLPQTTTNSHSELVILHSGARTTIDRFQLTIVVLAHTSDGKNIDTTLSVSDAQGQNIGTVHFTDLLQTQVIPGYSLRVVHATSAALQVVVSAL